MFHRKRKLIIHPHVVLNLNDFLFSTRVYLGSLRCSEILFSVANKHVNGTGEITPYLAQTGLP